MLFLGIQQQPYTVIPRLLGSDVGVLSHLWSQNDGIMSSLHRYTPTLILGSYFGVLVLGRPWSQNDGIMSLLRLTAPSNCYLHPSQIYTKSLYKVVEHIDMLSLGIWQQPQSDISTLLGSFVGVLGHLWNQNDVIMSWLRVIATSNCFPHPSQIYIKCLSTLTCCPQAQCSSHTQLYPHYLAQMLWFQVTFGVKLVSLRHG